MTISLPNRIDELKLLVAVINSTAFEIWVFSTLSEICLSSSISDAEIQLPGYTEQC